MFSAPMVLAGLWREHQLLKVPLFSRYPDQLDKPFTEFRTVLRVSSLAIHVVWFKIWPQHIWAKEPQVPYPETDVISNMLRLHFPCLLTQVGTGRVQSTDFQQSIDQKST